MKKHILLILKAFGAALSILLVTLAVLGMLVVGEYCGCVYSSPERHYSPDGEYVIAISYSNIYGADDGGYSCRLKVTASNRNGIFDVMSVTEKYSPVHSWNIEWEDDDTALLSMYYTSKKILVEFSDEEKPTFIELK